MKDLTKYPYEKLANAIYEKGEAAGIFKITDKTKWRESVMAEKLEHEVHKKISAGAGKLEYGSDAKDKDIYAEYKSKAINDDDLNNLFERINMLGYKMKVTAKAKDFIIDKGWDEQFGARPLKRAIQKYIEDQLAEEIISAKLTEGTIVNVGYDTKKDEIKITFTKPKEIEKV